MDEMLEGANGTRKVKPAAAAAAVVYGDEHSYAVVTANASETEDRLEQLFLRLAHTLHTDIGLRKADVWARYLIKKLQDWGYL